MEGRERAALIADHGRPVAFTSGDVLLHEGAAGDHCFGLVSGEVLVTTSSSTGSTVVLGRRGPGEIIGQLSLLDGGPRSARVLLTIHADATDDAVFRSTRDELAGWVGATREAVTRTLSDLADAGAVRLGRGEVELLQRSA